MVCTHNGFIINRVILVEEYRLEKFIWLFEPTLKITIIYEKNNIEHFIKKMLF
jgi:hypothetical protein